MSIPIQINELIEIFKKAEDPGMVVLYQTTRMREPVYWHNIKNIKIDCNYIGFSYITENKYGGWGMINLSKCFPFITDNNTLEVKSGKCTVQKFKFYNEPVNLHTLI